MNSYLMPSKIETPRLVLRILQDNDWRSLHEHYSDEACTKFTFGRALSEGESWRAMASMAGHWVLRGYGPYVLEEKGSGTVLGVTGLWYPNDWPEPEIKWALIRRHWGKGFAKEAARATQDMASKHLPDISLISLIDSNNAASIRLALAVDAVFEREIGFRNGVWHVYRHPKRS
jgi:RimJ/RimL family protein N-acetyltransferase